MKLRIPKQLVQMDINMPLNQLCDLRLRILHQQAKSRNIALYDQLLAKEIDHEKEKRDQQTIRHAFKRYLRKGEVCKINTLNISETTPEQTLPHEFIQRQPPKQFFRTNSSYNMNFRSRYRMRSPLKVAGVTQRDLEYIHKAETDDIFLVDNLQLEIRPYNEKEIEFNRSSSSGD